MRIDVTVCQRIEADGLQPATNPVIAICVTDSLTVQEAIDKVKASLIFKEIPNSFVLDAEIHEDDIPKPIV